MGGLSPVHMGLLLVIALLVFGPKKLPEIGRELGQALREFKKASREVMDSFHDAAEDRPRAAPAYDTYHPTSYPEASFPEDLGSAHGAPPAATGPAMPAAPPAGAVDRAAGALVHPREAAASSSTAELTPARESVTDEPARGPASERNG